MAPRPINIELVLWRTRRGLTPLEAASALSVATEDYRGWERGKPCPTPENILALISGMDVAMRIDRIEAAPAPMARERSGMLSRLRGGLSQLVPRGLLDGD
ncbi:helix-turn-helix domain-containing protein [Roseomonas elaeocarpi]|uniref:Helix-turn-helix domain-containing protein n=1 Tax=Roseomonas elaeocarpi TaxID=907779 RepID=A0ABV6JUZ2_9PROT